MILLFRSCDPDPQTHSLAGTACRLEACCWYSPATGDLSGGENLLETRTFNPIVFLNNTLCSQYCCLAMDDHEITSLSLRRMARMLWLSKEVTHLAVPHTPRLRSLSHASRCLSGQRRQPCGKYCETFELLSRPLQVPLAWHLVAQSRRASCPEIGIELQGRRLGSCERLDF